MFWARSARRDQRRLELLDEISDLPNTERSSRLQAAVATGDLEQAEVLDLLHLVERLERLAEPRPATPGREPVAIPIEVDPQTPAPWEIDLLATQRRGPVPSLARRRAARRTKRVALRGGPRSTIRRQARDS